MGYKKPPLRRWYHDPRNVVMVLIAVAMLVILVYLVGAFDIDRTFRRLGSTEK